MREAGPLGLREAPPGCLKPLGCSWSLDLRAEGLGPPRKPLGRGVVQKGFGGPMENGGPVPGLSWVRRPRYVGLRHQGRRGIGAVGGRPKP